MSLDETDLTKNRSSSYSGTGIYCIPLSAPSQSIESGEAVPDVKCPVSLRLESFYVTSSREFEDSETLAISPGESKIYILPKYTRRVATPAPLPPTHTNNTADPGQPIDNRPRQPDVEMGIMHIDSREQYIVQRKQLERKYPKLSRTSEEKRIGIGAGRNDDY
jgi:hypothetical protein